MWAQREREREQKKKKKKNLCCKSANGSIFHVPEQVFHPCQRERWKVNQND